MQSVAYPNGLIETRVYTGKLDREIYEAMDADLRKAEEAGGQLKHRGRIGRNAPCPCHSGRKFKKCCMAGARVINTI